MEPPEGPVAWLLSPEPISVFVPRSVPDQLVADHLLYDETGVLTDRELRWSAKDLCADLTKLADRLSPQNPEPVCFDEVADSALETARLLNLWRDHVALGRVRDATGEVG